MSAAAESRLPAPRELSGAKATRIVEAMRTSVAARGIAGSTFDAVAGEAGVSRGLLHYYFGTKERLLIEVVRREAEVRTERLEEAIEAADDAETVLDALVRSFEDWLGDGPAPVMIYEMLTLAQRNEEIAAELAVLGRRTRSHLGEALERKRAAGVLSLRVAPELAAMFLFALADGVIVRRLSEPELDIGPLTEQAIAAARAVLS
ncbi:MAG TPA: TetR/AcrR family transcriptional regulator [Solirubrobacteraceae bacterium]|nr:TetR/AcrR family transcriptional regulator [Solirubrobacteraceae bacterium]